ncbi:MAG: hypothetical protein IKW06_02305 [Clostridia bacterium]|nr:hypothetical protein [Clostridia bacterium]
MTASQLREILKSNLLVIAGAGKDAPENSSDYVEAGAHILLAPVCYNMDEEDEKTLKTLMQAASDKAFVAGQIAAPCDSLAEVGGTLIYDAYYDEVMEQAAWLSDQGVSMIFLNGFFDACTAKCAAYAVREADMDMPICAGISTTNIPAALSILITLQSLNICAFGCTDMDIDDALEVLSELQAFTTVPFYALTKGGMFLSPDMYGVYIASFVNQKCALFGIEKKSPAYVAEASKATWQLSPLAPDFPMVHAICSQNEIMFLDFQGKIVSQNKQLIEIKTENDDELLQALELFNRPGAAPVCFNIKDIDLLEYAISHYAGRPAVRSDEYGEITAKEFGAYVIKEPNASEE